VVTGNSCNHASTTIHTYPNGVLQTRCLMCGWTLTEDPVLIFDKTKREPPTHYLRRHPSCININGYANWEYRDWPTASVTNFAEAEEQIAKWNKHSLNGWEFRLPTHCERCYFVCSETFPSIGLEAGLIGKHVCSKCHSKGMENMKKILAKKKLPKAISNVNFDAILGVKIMTPPKLTLTHVRKEGEIWPLPTANAPYQSKQWGYQGSAKAPYVITSYAEKRDGSVTPEGWACSCMSFTRHMPRVDCKHILKVKLDTGVSMTSAKKGMAGLSDDEQKAFEQWKRDQAAAKTPVAKEGGNKLNLFGNMGRKFR
jgi:hypothetical protein